MMIELQGTIKTLKACGLVAQLDRVFDYESKGRRFESCRARVKNAEILRVSAFFLFVRNT